MTIKILFRAVFLALAMVAGAVLLGIVIAVVVTMVTDAPTITLIALGVIAFAAIVVSFIVELSSG